MQLMGSTRMKEQELTEDVIKNQDAIGKKFMGREVREEGRQCTLDRMACLHPFQILTLAPTKLTSPEKEV